MKPGARRRRSLIAIIILTVVVFGATAAIAYFARPEEVVRMTAQAQVAADGSAQIRETIAYRFSGLTHHGIYRDVPGLATDTPGIDATDDGRPAQVLVTSNDLALPNAHIRIGDPSRTVSGDHTYVVSYPLPTLIDVNGRLDWNGVGTGWAVQINQADLDIAGPWNWTDPTCQQGAEGSTTPCTVTQPQPGLLQVRVGHLATHEGVTVEAGRGAALAAAPALPAPSPPHWPPLGPSPLVPAAVAALTMLVAALAVRALLERAGRDEVVGEGATDVAFAQPGGSMHRVSQHELADMASIEFAPPKELTAWQGGILSTEQVADAHKVAWLLEAAIAGYVRLDEQDKTVTLVRLPVPAAAVGSGGAPPPPDPTTLLLAAGFGDRSEITLGHYDPAFAKMWTQVAGNLNGWMAGSDLWEDRGRHRRRIARGLGGLGFLIGLVGVVAATVAVARSGSANMVAVGLAGLVLGVGLAGLGAGFELMVRTPTGSGLWVRVESFRRFLHDSEGPQAEQAAKLGVVRQYTAWAIALDEVHHWTKAVEAAGPAVSQVDRAGFNYVYLAPLLMTSTHTASVAPHQSSGVGGGVGGGFGGGGGGSW